MLEQWKRFDTTNGIWNCAIDREVEYTLASVTPASGCNECDDSFKGAPQVMTYTHPTATHRLPRVFRHPPNNARLRPVCRVRTRCNLECSREHPLLHRNRWKNKSCTSNAYGQLNLLIGFPVYEGFGSRVDWTQIQISGCLWSIIDRGKLVATARTSLQLVTRSIIKLHS